MFALGHFYSDGACWAKEKQESEVSGDQESENQCERSKYSAATAFVSEVPGLYRRLGGRGEGRQYCRNEYESKNEEDIIAVEHYHDENLKEDTALSISG